MSSARSHVAGRSVLVTGGTGFIGANLVRALLRDGAEVHVVARPGSDWARLRDVRAEIRVHTGDVIDGRSVAHALDAASPTHVFHLATARGHDRGDASALVSVPVLGALRLIDGLKGAQATRLVATGSSLEYGPSEIAHHATDALHPATWHGIGKAGATMVFTRAAQAFGLRIQILRLFHVYGPWEGAGRLVPTSIRRAFSGAPMTLTSPGFRRDFVHVDDVVDALLTAARTSEPSGVWNVGSGIDVDNIDVVSAVENVTGRPIARAPTRFPASPADTAHRIADIRATRERLGWEPTFDLETGLAATVEWYLRNPAYWDAGGGGRPGHV